jgi:hypothetical protein|uniref:Uncharacterized protein n=2 Tax=Picea TaxID=3328 RepID=A0A101LWV3_PICGL|nr:hypothetical protein ABT39_MTgene6257 [Picea glauca]QHR92641.1 hypothetical protein Q903MT_gene6688 [Picea sitchensis]
MRVDGFPRGMNNIIIGKNRMMKSASFLQRFWCTRDSLTKEYVWELAQRPWIAIPRERGRKLRMKGQRERGYFRLLVTLQSFLIGA